jgi:hypothetical protein
MGAGAMTGGRRGLCGRSARTSDAPVYGYGYGRGRGLSRGFGRGRGYGPGPVFGGSAYPAVRPADEMAMLQADAEAMQKTLNAIQNRIQELEKQAAE